MWIQLTSGSGPAECQLFVAKLCARFVAAAEQAGLECRTLDAAPGEQSGGLKSALLSLDGAGSEAFARRWVGTHKWICASPYRPNHRRKNWYCGVRIVEAPLTTDWDASEVRLDAMRSSGPGGQHVNKTSSAVRATHIPTGISTVAQNERSQHRNRQLALAQLGLLLADRDAASKSEAERAHWLQHWTLERGNEVRVYRGEQFKEERGQPDRGV